MSVDGICRLADNREETPHTETSIFYIDRRYYCPLTDSRQELPTLKPVHYALVDGTLAP